MILTVATSKGGVGKTSTAVALAQAAVLDGKKVLCVDLDAQANMTHALHGDKTAAGVYETMLEPPIITKCIQTTPQGIDLVPGSWSLSTITEDAGAATKLKDALENVISDYDLVICDTPPNTGVLQLTAIMAADEIIVPVMSDIYAIPAIHRVSETVDIVRKNKDKPNVRGVLICLYDARSTLSKQMAQAIINDCAGKDYEFLGAIRAGIAIKESTALQENLFQYAGNSKPAADYETLYRRLFSNN